VPRFRQGKTRKLQGPTQVLGAPFIMDGELYACVGACRFIGGEFVPQPSGSFVVAAAFCEHRQIAAGLRVKI
jgi:hypothetical protein